VTGKIVKKNKVTKKEGGISLFFSICLKIKRDTATLINLHNNFFALNIDFLTNFLYNSFINIAFLKQKQNLRRKSLKNSFQTTLCL